ncbi:MAG TPA: SIMPL domain-containing protein [Mycobacteriales bacterium]
MATVLVRGSARAEVEPDRVRIAVTVSADAAAGPEALALLAERSAAAEGVLDAADLLARRPAGVSLQPRWGQQQGEIVGQTAQRTFVAEAAAGSPLGELLARLVDVPGTTVAGAEWLVDDANPAHSRLRAAAVADAHARAADYAQAAGLRLGALDRVAEPGLTEPGPHVWVPQSARALGFAGDTAGGGGPVLELRPQPVELTAAVDVRWSLLD